MTFQRSILTVVAVAAARARVGSRSPPTPAPPTVPTHAIAANVNDPGIRPDAAAPQPRSGSRPTRRGGSGSCSCSCRTGARPTSRRTSSEIGSEAGRLGYHTIVLAYRNEAPIAAPPPVGCGNSVDAADLAAELRDQRAHGDPRRARGIDRRQRRSGEQHREPAEQGAPAPGGDLPRRRLVAVPRHQRPEPAPSGRRP